jgi:hypothetical protein
MADWNFNEMSPESDWPNMKATLSHFFILLRVSIMFLELIITKQDKDLLY